MQDDVVATHDEGAANEREPLLILEPLRAFLDEHGLGGGDLDVAPVGEGHSNVTFLVKRDGADLVLRRPPRGPLPPSAHDVLREASIMRRLEGRVRLPRIAAVCDDPSVVGAPFFVMERVEGHVVTREVPPALDTVDDRRRMGEDLIDALVEVHAVDWRACGLDSIGRPTGYLERQVRRFLGLWEHNRTRELPVVEAVARWLGDHVPASPEPTVVHGDYRLGNTMVGPAPPARVAAIFDWEMATIGDPLADLGYLAATWVDRNDPPLGHFELSSVTRQEGFPVREELIARYEERSGRSVTDLRWYRTLALWKAAVFMEGNFKRALAGSSDDPYVKDFEQGVVELAERAHALTREA
jgi:aminoglycoside phosphotransferase (APT) family kinase protein